MPLQTLFLLVFYLKGTLGMANGPVDLRSRARKNVLSFCAGICSFSMATPAARAVKGAFELDAEYYIKNLLKLDGEKGAPFPDKIGAGRDIDPIFSRAVVAIVEECIASTAHCSIEEIRRRTQEQLNILYLPYFANFVSLKNGQTFSDSNFLGIYLFTLYKVAETLIPQSPNRVKLQAAIGSAILNQIEEVIKIPPSIPGSKKEIQAEWGRSVADSLTEVLTYFQSVGSIKSFKFDTEDLLDSIFSVSTWEAGSPLPVQITLIDPV